MLSDWLSAAGSGIKGAFDTLGGYNHKPLIIPEMRVDNGPFPEESGYTQPTPTPPMDQYSEGITPYAKQTGFPQEWLPFLEKYSQQYDFDPKFSMGSIRQEAGGWGYKVPDVGPAGEVGIAQVIPKYYPQFDIEKLKTPEGAIEANVRILKQKLHEAEQMGYPNDYGLALAKYNAGGNPKKGLPYAKIVFDHIGVPYTESKWLSEQLKKK